MDARSRQEKVRLKLIEWFEYNLATAGVTKSSLADACGVKKQAVTRWFSHGIISKENLISAARFFNTEAPLDLMAYKAEVASNPLSYGWAPDARKVVEMLMQDNGNPNSLSKIRLVQMHYDGLNKLSKDNEDDLIKQAFIHESDSAARKAFISTRNVDGDGDLTRVGPLLAVKFSNGVECIHIPAFEDQHFNVIKGIIVDYALASESEYKDVGTNSDNPDLYRLIELLSIKGE